MARDLFKIASREYNPFSRISLYAAFQLTER
jgi:hypothetical protein